MTEFANLGLSPTTLQAVADTGYTTATPIQAQAIPVALAGRDVLGIAQTGTGKTAAFTLPLIDRLSSGRAKARMPRALVLAPTRELADQVAMSFEKYAKGTKLSWVLLIGGVSMGDQVAALNKGVDVLIATPGRLLDLFERGKMHAERRRDDGRRRSRPHAGHGLHPGHRAHLQTDAAQAPDPVLLGHHAARDHPADTQFLKDPTRIEASRPAQTAETITQYLVRIPTSDPKAKRAALRALVGREDVRNGIVFCNRKSEVDVVAKSLKSHGFDAAPIHGDLDQSLRMKTLADFRSGALKILVASDVAARGLDIPDVSHVFNYDVSHHADDYVHRIGRTGRAGKLGQAFMIVTPADDKVAGQGPEADQDGPRGAEAGRHRLRSPARQPAATPAVTSRPVVRSRGSQPRPRRRAPADRPNRRNARRSRAPVAESPLRPSPPSLPPTRPRPPLPQPPWFQATRRPPPKRPLKPRRDRLDGRGRPACRRHPPGAANPACVRPTVPAPRSRTAPGKVERPSGFGEGDIPAFLRRPVPIPRLINGRTSAPTAFNPSLRNRR
jgi:superfamily II DNA/RNA helicase